MDEELSELEDAWRDLLPPGPSRGLFTPAPQKVADERLMTWVEDLVEEDSPSLLALPYSGSAARDKALQQVFQIEGAHIAGSSVKPRDWLDDGVYPAFEARVSRLLGGSPWSWVIDMLRGPVFVAEEPLRSMIDDNVSLATGLFNALWDLRFRMQERTWERHPRALAAAIFRWLTGNAIEKDLTLLASFRIDRELASEQERVEMMLFLMALARQNGLFDRVVLTFDGLDQAVRFSQQKRRTLLKPLTDLTLQVERWGKLRSGVGLVLCYSTSYEGDLASLKQFAPMLHKRVRLAAV